mgnify:CR=1 FL=1
MSEPTKVVILAGGLGTRLSEETDKIPKPMVEIGGRPILWHIMKHYAHFGFNEFFIALGYKGEVIKRYFLDYYTLSRNMTINLKTGDVAAHDHDSEDWTVHLIDTGQETNTGGRVKRLAPILKDATFMVTYGDGVTNADINLLLAFHRSHGRLATITAVRPPSRFGGLSLSQSQVVEFIEKPQIGEGWINGGFMVFQPGILDYLQGDKASLEVTLLERLAAEGQLMAYEHGGFWQCMDTVRDVNTLRALWESANPPWKVWEK